MANDPSSPRFAALRFFRLLLWVHWRSLCARLRGLKKQSPLLIFVLAAFVAGYLFIGYWLFHTGMSKLYEFPVVGTLLSQRILFLVFGFFFVMLAVSNFIIGYSTLFKNRETSWLLTMPISHSNVYRWKFLESLAVSSWALIFLSAPMMAAFGRLHNAGGLFYAEVLGAYLPFVVIPALLGSWGILFFVRIISKPWIKKALLVLAGLAVAALVFNVKPVKEADINGDHDERSFYELLRHTRVGLNPFLPSAWLARSVLSWSDGISSQGNFYLLVLVSNAAMGLLVGFEVAGKTYYGSWTVAASNRAERFLLRAEARRGVQSRSLLEEAVHRLPFFSRPVKALALKDIFVFWRDPAQWTQFMIFFGLLCIYVLNLRNVAFTFQSEFWETTISYLNLAASALTLSTLTTRFVFPQFSLEGRRLWIVGLAPLGLPKVLMQKFWLSCCTSMAITVSLMVASSMMLHLPAARVFWFAAAIAIMSATLSGAAVGLGALFPNLKEDNPSKIVSGFGGTLCLVVSFFYIACFIALAAIPGMRRVMHLRFLLPNAVALGLAVLLSACVLFLPMIAAMRRVKNLEF